MAFYSRFYRSLFYLHAAIVFFEFSLTLALIIVSVFLRRDIFFNSGKVNDENWNSVDENILITIVILFLLGTVRSVVLFAFILMLSFMWLPLILCLLCSDYRKNICRCIKAKATHRFFSFNCNCPCYRPRPKLRFQLQFAFLILVCCMRLATIILCITIKQHYIAKNFAVIVAMSFFFLILTSLLDYYHYRVWWYYAPGLSGKDIEIPEKPLSKKHKRYLPYELLGNNRTKDVGNKLCTQEPCTNRKLEHILVFHLSDYQPQPRWSELKKLNPSADVYIGFHRTLAQSAVHISHSDFRPSTTGKQMLGYGVYFARSIENTLGKARYGGAIIAAEVRMGKVKEVTKRKLRTVSNTDSWHAEFDTVYYNHDQDTRDEFCVRDPGQVLRWIVVIDEEFDSKIEEYNMANEFNDTKCFCV